ncbi:hypothetical protein D5039_13705 [Verminephrobacter aporrectodeae subsp. tuberculatae]|uniref:Uncharacterized protein n=1 Tax=Verminephrobacter aporrectodeae subsp. tuberculatae TaxID=1110392 RepID=A0ABT3KV99_9BURK|nr:hypothetical protein [Verminephrobacter aporrectodeae subsp. tuberculatae]
MPRWTTSSNGRPSSSGTFSRPSRRCDASTTHPPSEPRPACGHGYRLSCGAHSLPHAHVLRSKTVSAAQPAHPTRSPEEQSKRRFLQKVAGDRC